MHWQTIWESVLYPYPVAFSYSEQAQAYSALLLLLAALALGHGLFLSGYMLYLVENTWGGSNVAQKMKTRLTEGFWDLGVYFVLGPEVSVELSGDKLGFGPAVILSTHQSLADYFVLHSVKRQTETAEGSPAAPIRAFYFAWTDLWRTPTVKTLYHVLRCNENWSISELDTCFAALTEKLTVTPPAEPQKEPSEPQTSKTSPQHIDWIILFPEVNIRTKEITQQQQNFCRQNYLPVLENLLYPRFSAFSLLVRALQTQKHREAQARELRRSQERAETRKGKRWRRIIRPSSRHSRHSRSEQQNERSETPQNPVMDSVVTETEVRVYFLSIRYLDSGSSDAPSLFELCCRRAQRTPALIRINVSDQTEQINTELFGFGKTVQGGTRPNCSRKRVELWLEKQWVAQDGKMDENN